MKRSVVVDTDGRILATTPHHEPGDELDTGGPLHKGFVPLGKQKVHVIDIPEHLHSPEGLMELHRSHRVVVKSGKAQIVQTK